MGKIHQLTFLPNLRLDPNVRLRIATRIHFALLRHYSEDVAVSTLLKGEADAREALWVCEASDDVELVALARRFDEAGRAEANAAHVGTPQPAKGAVTQELAWSRDTSGFGLSRPLEFSDTTDKPALWMSPSRWLRRGTPR